MAESLPVRKHLTVDSVLSAHVDVFPSLSSAIASASPTLQECLDAIAGQLYAGKVQELRRLYDMDIARYDAAKALLPAFTPTGTFRERRSNATLAQHSGVVHVDIDDLSDANDIRDILKNDPYCLYLFTSPSGYGVKFAAYLPDAVADASEYAEAWDALAAYLSHRYGVTIDPNPKDVARLCFFSWDPLLCCKLDARPFTVPFSSRKAHINFQRPGRPPGAIPRGERNATLFKAATSMRRYGASQDAIVDGLMAMNGHQCVPPLPASEILQIAISACRYDPVPPPQPTPTPASSNGHARAHTTRVFSPDDATLHVIDIAEMIATPPSWLWEPYIAFGGITLLDGEPGTGKSLLSLGLAAAVTRGFPLPDQQGRMTITQEARSVMYFCTEDSIQHTVLPRFDACGGDRTRLQIIDGAVTPREPDDIQPFFFDHIGPLEAYLNAAPPHTVGLVIFDPVQAYFGPKNNMNHANETRPLLARLNKLAQVHDLALLIVRHPSKASLGVSAIHRGMGSTDIMGNARNAFFAQAIAGPEHLIWLCHTKSNLGVKGITQRFCVAEGRFQWAGVSQLDTEHIAGVKRGPNPGALLEACHWLEMTLAPYGAMGMLWDDLVTMAEEHGIAARTLERARSVVRLRRHRDSGNIYRFSVRIP